MNYLTFEEQEEYVITLLVPEIRKEPIEKAYFQGTGLIQKDVIIFDLHFSRAKKTTPVSEMREYLREMVLPYVKEANSEYILVADSAYFKLLSGAKKVEANLGYVLDIAQEFQDILKCKVVYVPNYKAIFYNPKDVESKISKSIHALVKHRVGLYQDPGSNIIRSEYYPEGEILIGSALQKLFTYDELTVDIEAFSLNPVHAGIGTISFAWNKHEGIAFKVDYRDLPDPVDGMYGEQVTNLPVRRMLKQFFNNFKGKLIYHNISFDVTALIYQLFMDDVTDTLGLLEGLQVMLKNWEDTKLVTYLATNSCAGNKLSLKDQAQEFAGNYAQDDIKDIRRIPSKDLLRYNLVDSLSTWFVLEKHWNQMVLDQQQPLYEGLFKDATQDIIQMQLTGLPINMQRVYEVEGILQEDMNKAMSVIQSSPLIAEFVQKLNEEWVVAKNNTLKKKRVTLADANESFNPSSPIQLQNLLYKQLELPVLDYTDSKQPATGGSILKSLKNHTKDPLVLELLDALIDLKAVDKILTAFIPAFKNAVQGKDGWHYLLGSYNLGGTVSGRLSSSNPNMQQIPAGGPYGKLIKSCFQAPPGWLLIGLDYSSLEDRISALTTRDPNKLRVYIEGFDGHCLRAYSYFGHLMQGIDPSSVESINSIADLYKDLRGRSKAPTFLLTYGGSYLGLIKNCGFTEEEARAIEAAYHELYKVSDAWVAEKIEQATKDGYITAAFGLRVRTPLLHQVIRGNSKTPHEAEAEARTAGNALGQSWCLLNSRSSAAFMKRAREDYKDLIRPCAQIHDAFYMMVPDNLEIIRYVNKHLVQETLWQDDPAIYHPEVGLGGELSIFYPTWAQELELPNGASEQEILALVDKHTDSL